MKTAMNTNINTNINTNTTNSKKVIPGINDVATKCPMAATMWSDKNTFSPSKVAAGSRRKFTFVCPDCGQEFESKIFSVVRSVMNGNTGCPVCAGRKAVSGVNDLATMYPKAAAMWSGKNDYAPSEIPARSSRRAIFVCPDCKQEFVTSIHNMTRAIASGVTCCPNCRLRGACHQRSSQGRVRFSEICRHYDDDEGWQQSHLHRLSWCQQHHGGV